MPLRVDLVRGLLRPTVVVVSQRLAIIWVPLFARFGLLL
jgi:hypothetical protein